MSNLLKRSITGLFFGIAVIGAVLWNKHSLHVLLLFVNYFCLKEYFNLVGQNWSTRLKLGLTLLYMLPLCIAIWFSYAESFNYRYSLETVVLLSVVAVALDLLGKAGANASGKLIKALLFISLPVALMVEKAFAWSIESDPPEINYVYKGWPLLFAFFITWANDVGAYFIGKFFGRRKLIEHISPNKTWEGFWGGFFLSVIVAGLSSSIISLSYSSNNRMTMIILSAITGGMISIFAVLGDLFQSSVKRQYGAKDSGNILPGHGGMWDRFDALLFGIYGYYLVNYIAYFF